MIALLFSGDKSPLDETICRGSRAAGASSIFSETFGKVAHALLRLKMDTNRSNSKKGLTLVIHYLIKK
jgi:hypothetical protein